MTRIHHGIDHELLPLINAYYLQNQSPNGNGQADVPLKGLIYLIRAYHSLLIEDPDLECLRSDGCAKGQPWMN